MFQRQTMDKDDLRSRVFAGEEFDAMVGQVEKLCEELDQQGVGAAFDWRGLHGDFQSRSSAFAMHTDD
jgi:hypothetical protein